MLIQPFACKLSCALVALHRLGLFQSNPGGHVQVDMLSNRMDQVT